MKTYWDYSEKERSEMGEEQIRALLDVELMSKGVKKVEAPILKPVKSVEIETEVWFEVGDVFFKTAEQAQQFLALNPKHSTYEYSCGYDYHYAAEIESEIKQSSLYSRQALLDLASILKENKAAKAYNEDISSAHEKRTEEVDKVLNGVWEDWYECKTKAAQHRKVLETRSEYMKLTDNNADLADTFLKKVYSTEEIKEADAWFGDDAEER